MKKLLPYSVEAEAPTQFSTTLSALVPVHAAENWTIPSDTLTEPGVEDN